MFIHQDGPWVRIEAPAKLNLFLEVVGKREDGYHELETLMAAVALYDTLEVADNPTGEISLSCRWAEGLAARDCRNRGRSPATGYGDLPAGAENLVVRAVNLLRRRAGVESGLAVRLIKRIPSAAGLGGGSSDAAAALVAANRIWRLGWERPQLATLAAELGSDIPFFFSGGAAICRGRGERVESLRGVGPLHVVIVRPPEGLATSDVYRHCRPSPQPQAVTFLQEAWRQGRIDLVGQRMLNRLQEAARTLTPWIDRLQVLLHRFACPGHQLSGSGSSYFAVCHTARHARCVAGALKAAGLDWVFPSRTLTFPTSGAFEASQS